MAQERRSLRTVLIAGAVVVLGIGAIGTVGAVQAHGGFSGARGHGPGFGGPTIDRALGSVDANDAQRADIRKIMDQASADISKRTADFDALREQAATLLTAETIDRAAFETLRQQALAMGDDVSARALAAFLDAAEILTPEQRAKLLEQQHGFGPRFGAADWRHTANEKPS